MSAIDWPKVMEDLLNEDDVDRMVEASEIIATQADESDLDKLYALIEHEDFFVRETAAEPLARLEQANALPVLFRALNRGAAEGHDNDGLSATIADLLERGKKAALPLLLNMIEAPEDGVRENAAWALGYIEPEITPAPLLRAMSDQNAGVRAAAAGSLSSFKNDPAVFDSLIAALSDDDEHVRISSVSALSYLGDNRAIPYLQKLNKGFFNETKRFVKEALKQLGATEK